MTFIYKGYAPGPMGRDFMAELCTVHWLEDASGDELKNEHSLITIATLTSADGQLCHVPCIGMRVTELAKKLSAQNGIPMPSWECEALVTIETSVSADWEIGLPKNECMSHQPENTDLVWMETPMPPPGLATVLDVEGNSRQVIVAPRLVSVADHNTYPKNHWLRRGEALVGVIATTYRATWEVAIVEPVDGNSCVAHLWPFTRQIPLDVPEADDIYSHLGPGDDDYFQRQDVYRQLSPELAATVCCEKAGFGNEYSSLLRERAETGEVLWEFEGTPYAAD